MTRACGEQDVNNKVFYSDPNKDKIVCIQTYNLLVTLHKLGLKFDVPLREILYPMSLDGTMLDKFIQAFIRLDDDD